MKTLKYDLDQTVASFILGMISSVVLVSAAIVINYFTINNAFLLVGLLILTLVLNGLFGFLIYRHVMTINSAINKGLAGISTKLYYGLTLAEKPKDGNKNIEELAVLENDVNELLERYSKLEPTISGEPIPEEVEKRIKAGGLLSKGEYNQAVFFLSQANASYRSAFILIRILNPDIQPFMGELVKGLREYFEEGVIGEYLPNTIALFLPKVNSLSLLKAKIENFYIHFVPTKVEKNRKGMEVAQIRIGGAIYPYTTRRDLERDALFALEKSKDYFIYLPAIRQSDISHRETFESVGRLFLLNAEALILEAKNVQNKDSFDKFIRQNLLKISSQFGFHNAGYLLLDASLDEFRVGFEDCRLHEHPTFQKLKRITFDDLQPIFAAVDASGAVYGSDVDSYPISLGKILTNLDIKTFHFQVIGNKERTYGLVYFCSSQKNRSLTVSEQTILNFAGALLGTFIKEVVHSDYERSKNELLEHVLKMDERYVYVIDKNTFSLNYLSSNLASFYKSQKTLGERCYKVFHNRDSICPNCPLKVGSKEIPMPLISPLPFLRSLMNFSANSHETAISIRPLRAALAETEPRYLDMDFSIKNRRRLELDVQNAVSDDRNGYLFSISLCNVPPTVSFEPDEVMSATLNLLCRKLENASFGDFIYRYSGNTLFVSFPEATRAAAFSMAESIYATAREIGGNDPKSPHFWMTIAAYPGDVRDAAAIEAMLTAGFKSTQKAGNDMMYVADNKKTRKAERKGYVLDLIREAVTKQKFEIYINPIMNINNTEPVGGELVSRLYDPNRGYISTSEFLATASEAHLLVDIEKALLYNVGEMWKNYGFDLFRQNGVERLAVNVSTDSVLDSGFREAVKQIVSRYKFPKGFLQLEISEKTVAEKENETRKFMKDLQGNNIVFCLDNYTDRVLDFQIAASLPFNCVKFERDLVRGIESDSSAFLSFDHLRAKIREMNNNIIIEGIETEDQANIVKRLNIRMVQGFYFAKPMSISDFLKFVGGGK